jgi:hypothetical protein
MTQYTCVIAYVSNPDEETTVVVEAKDRAQALIENFNQRPGTYVKSIEETNSTS